MVYTIKYSPDRSLRGYVNYTLSYFNTEDFPPSSRPNLTAIDVDICRLVQRTEIFLSGEISKIFFFFSRYPDFREPHWTESTSKYEQSLDYWYILVARLAFVLVFQNVVTLVTVFVGWCIPDVPRKLSEQIRQEAYLTNEIIIKQEMIRSRGTQAAQAVNVNRITHRVYPEFLILSNCRQGDSTAWSPSYRPCSNHSSLQNLDSFPEYVNQGFTSD